MTQATTKSLLELIDERPKVDNQDVFDQLWDIMGELRAKINAQFSLTPDASTASLQPYYSLDQSAKGYLSTFTGPEIDWLVHSWIGNPKYSFTNMHLTCWLGPHINVPHWGMALGTMPDIFVYLDYVPRVDLLTHLDYHDQYFEPVNESNIRLQKDARFSHFFSKTLYMRTSQSPTSHCYLVPANTETIAIIRELAHEMLDRWLGYVRNAQPVPMAERAALAERDLFLRRTVAERDPANAMGVRLFGEPMTDQLVRALWGGDRVNQRPT
jgi:hypothetical protein